MDNIYSKSGMQKLKNAEGEEIDREWKNYCVVDDSSKFAAAVYYHYINKEILKDKDSNEKTAYGIDLWVTNSEEFLKDSKVTKKLSTKKLFKLITWDTLKKKRENDIIELYYNSKRSGLEVGDLICRKGHVEFYIGNNKVVSWGRVYKTYTHSKNFEPTINGYKSNDSEDRDIPFTTIIRLRR